VPGATLSGALVDSAVGIILSLHYDYDCSLDGLINIVIGTQQHGHANKLSKSCD
jgi:hypothetical protein